MNAYEDCNGIQKKPMSHTSKVAKKKAPVGAF